MDKIRAGIIFLITLMICLPSPSIGNEGEYRQVRGLIDLRSTMSDGAHTIESLVSTARDRGYGAVVINDHDILAMEYAPPPFRNLIKKRVSLPSIHVSGIRDYLQAIRAAREKYPDMIIIPGTESVPFYYWTGSPLKKNLTAHNHERRILTMGMEQPETYEQLPVIHNKYAKKYLRIAFPEIILMAILFIVSIILVRWKGLCRVAGILIILWVVLSIADRSQLKSSPFDQYQGDQGIAPYQLFIDYVEKSGGLTYWNYPETQTGVRKLGYIYVDTPPYPQVLEESRNYTGFAALYGDRITITEPGNLWDKVLGEYCAGLRTRPVWGIATADFHEEGGSAETLGNYATVLLVKKRTHAEVMNALKQGRCYAYQGRYPQSVVMEEFSVGSSLNAAAKGYSGECIQLEGHPRIKIDLKSNNEKGRSSQVKVRLIRRGEVIATFESALPLSVEYEDTAVDRNNRSYYRFDMIGEGTLVSNPIFVDTGKTTDS